MRSSDRSRLPLLLGALVLLWLWPRRAEAQLQAQGFALDRLYLSAPGAGWFVMDSLDMRGGLGGAISLTSNYARDPWRVSSSDGSQRLAVVSDESLVDLGFAATYDRFRLYLNFDMPLTVVGDSGVVGGVRFTSPNASQPYTPSGVNLSTAPDAFADGRAGFDARLLGAPHDPFRLGASAQLFVPSTNTPNSEYLSDGTFRAMGRVLFAGDVGSFSYAGQVGVHVRPFDETPVPGAAQGSELLFGLAGGARYSLDATTALIVGPEVFGASAFRSLLGSQSTALEGLLTARVEGTADNGRQIRVRLGTGVGSDQAFGAPAWRFVVGVEVFDHSTGRGK